MTPSSTALLGSSLVFDRTGQTLISAEPDAISVVELGAGGQTTRLPIRDVRTVAAITDQLWVVTCDDRFVRIDRAGRSLAAARSLPYGARAVLQPAPFGPAAAVWPSSPVLALIDDVGQFTATEIPDVDLALPITGRRFVTACGAKLTLPSGLVTQFPPNTTVLGGVVMADGKSVTLLVAQAGGRQLVVVGLGTGQITQRCTVPSYAVRIATRRNLAVAQLEPRVTRILDLHTGRELGTISCDRDVIDHAIDPDGHWLAVRYESGAIELLDIVDVPRRAPGLVALPAGSGLRPDGGRPVPSPAARAMKTRALDVVARGRYARGRFTVPDDISDEFELRSPTTREVLGVFPCGAHDIDDAVGSAAGAQLHWESLAIEARLEMLSRIEPVLLERGDELAVTMQRELGRPGWECRRELESLIPRMHDLFTLARQHIGEVARGARVRHRAHGVVALVSPVMLPLATAHTHLLSALVTGNTVVWKPSSLAAGSAQLYIEILHAAGMPAGVVNLVQGRAPVARRLLAHPGIDGAVFVGSREHAREVRRELCDRLDLATLVHAGAKNAAIVVDGAELDRAASEIATCAFLSSGQRSTALGRVLVQAALLRPLLAALVAHTRRLAATPRFAGPLISAERYDRYFARLRAAESDGASVIARPESRPDSLSVGPSIHLVEDRARAVDYMRDELFGPDLAIEPVADLGDALARLHGHDMLIASLFAAAERDRARFEDEASAGALFWNHAPSAISGWLSFAAKGGPERGPTGLLAMTRRVAYIGAASALATPWFTEEVACPAHEMIERRVS